MPFKKQNYKPFEMEPGCSRNHETQSGFNCFRQGNTWYYDRMLERGLGIMRIIVEDKGRFYSVIVLGYPNEYVMHPNSPPLPYPYHDVFMQFLSFFTVKPKTRMRLR
jgi:hypothetical protein